MACADVMQQGFRREAQRSGSDQIPRPEGRCTGHLARAVRRGWWARGEKTQRERHQRDPGRVCAGLPFDGRLVGVLRGKKCALASKRRGGAPHGVDEDLLIFLFSSLFLLKT